MTGDLAIQQDDDEERRCTCAPYWSILPSHVIGPCPVHGMFNRELHPNTIRMIEERDRREKLKPLRSEDV